MTYSSACRCAACLVARPLNAEIARLSTALDRKTNEAADRDAEVAQFLRAWDETLDDLDAARKAIGLHDKEKANDKWNSQDDLRLIEALTATIERVKALAAQWEQVGPSYQSLPEGAAQLRQALDEIPLATLEGQS